MKIVQISQVWSLGGGVGTYLLNVSLELSRRGHEIVALHSDLNPASSPFLKEQYCIPGFAGFENENSAATDRQALEILESQKPDIVHIHANDNFPLEVEIRRRFPALKTFHVYEFCPAGTKFHHALGKACQHPTGPLCLARMGYKRCTKNKRPWVWWQQYRRAVAANRSNGQYKKIIVASDYVRRQALASGYRPEQIEILPYFTPLTNLPLVEKKETGGKKILFFTGRIVAEKGWKALLKALALLPPTLDWKMIVDGDGQELKKMMNQTQHSSFRERVEFPGWLNQGRHSECFQKASIVLVPSLWPEPFGLVGIEAMSYGKPVVAFDSGGIPEWLNDGVTGFLVRQGNYQQMAEKIAFLLQYENEAQKMGLQGRKKAETEFSAQRHVQRLEEIYRKVINGKS